MSVRRKLGVLAVAASVCTLGSLPQNACSQLPAATPPQPTAPLLGITNSPVAPTTTEAVRVANIVRDNSLGLGSDPDDPGPLAKDLSPAIKPADVAQAMHKVADWQLAQSQQYFTAIDHTNNPDHTRIRDGRLWTWSVLYAGYMAAASSLGEDKYRDAMTQIGKADNWGLHSAVPGADDQSIAQMYLELYLLGRQPEQLAPIKAALDAVLAKPRVQLGSGQRIEWWWCDALFMSPPVWARMYAATGDTRYISYLDEEFAKTSQLLYDRQAHLYSRDASYIDKQEKNGRKMFWSRGQGWAMGGLARTLEYLPNDDPARAKYILQLRQMAAAVAKLQGSDGLWPSGMLDSDAYGQPEISGSSLMTFGIAWGINNGVLDRKIYTPVVTKAWAGMLRHIYADGRLGDIQQTGAAPSTFKPSASYNYGVGGFLLAGSEIYKMADTKHPAGHK